MKLPLIYLVSPCYNEEDALPITSKAFADKINSLINSKKIAAESKILFVDDGSSDDTWNIIKNLNCKNPKTFEGVKLSKNRGHQNALLAGLMAAKEKCDAVISLDADLQDDINAIDEMIEKFKNGAQIVYGVRSDRQNDTIFKKSTALIFYKFLESLGVESVRNHADFRLTSRSVLNDLENFNEVNLYMRAIFPQIGYKQEIVYYSRQLRDAGESKYPFNKMLGLAIDGVTSFSVKPLRVITTLGLAIIVASIVVTLYLLYVKLSGGTPQGLSFIAISIWLLGGVQMCSIGIVGEYIGKIYMETKARPRYIIEETV
ncbi:MAG: glycosyltransferase family 2 protein [Bifidobacteriaceae bacterium]|jgi:glycosyltransferase involved in cell wall biosynthesis|nr:glycosyltransferase family 2 protein [Bifidobacteriaceae bacterium]